MGKLGTLTRRTFLVGSAAVAGGVVFGIYKAKQPLPNPLANAGDGSIGLTPYVKIDPNGVSIIVPRAEMGQGVHSSLAALVAEELDVAWEDISVEHGPAAAAYYNAAVMDEALPGISPLNKSAMAERMRDVGSSLSKLLGMQITGGSSSVPDAFLRYRQSGAAARIALLGAAAETFNLNVDELTTDNGVVVLPDGRRISYMELASAAVSIELPEEPSLKSSESWRYVGKSMPRIDIVDKSVGAPIYGVDVQLDGMLYATVRNNPRLQGAALRFDDGKARKVRGVIDVLPTSSGVAVVADNTWRAFKGAEALDIQWEASQYNLSTEEIYQKLADKITRGGKNSRFRKDGDVEEVFDSLPVIEAEYRAPALAHAAMEPMAATVLVTDEKVEIWAGTQVPLRVKQGAAKLARTNEENVHVHALMIGGSFGRRLDADYIDQAVEVALQFKGTPIKVTWTREEDMTHDFVRPHAVARLRGAVKDGQVHALDASLSHISVSQSWFPRITGMPAAGPDPLIVQGAWDQPYAIPNFRVTGYNGGDLLPVGSWRSVGASSNGFLQDGFLDELIHAAGADPIDERIRLATDDSARKVLQRLKSLADWKGPVGPGSGKGRGVSLVYSFGVPAATVVDVSHSDRGVKVDRITMVVDVGTVIDPTNVHAQVMGGALWGLGHAILGEITHEDGLVQQTNFHQFDGIRTYQVPELVIEVLENQESIKGIGEPAVPPVAPALASALFSLTGERYRELPLKKHIKFA